MADQITTRERLPIKLILPDQGASRPVNAGGSKDEPFRPADEQFRLSLSAQVSAIERALDHELVEVGAAPVRVQLIRRAFAKTHRPTTLFSERTCPIVGGGRLGELFLKATPEGLAELRRTIARNETARMIKELSTVESIEAITPVLRRKHLSTLDVQRSAPRVDDEFFMTRVRLFDLGDPDQHRIVDDFKRTCQARGLPASQHGYSSDGQVYAVACRSDQDIDALSRVVGVRSVVGMPLLRTIRSEAFNGTAVPDDLPLSTDMEGDYPVVVVVDTGITQKAPALATWVAGSESAVADPYRNTTHGTFVAGLVVYGGHLNPQLPDVAIQPCGVFDLQVLPNVDPEFGDTEFLTESEFLHTLEIALKKHANRYKVWNLSLSTDEVCADDEFSAFAAELDDLQERYQVTFVIAAGNYNTRPLLAYPREGEQLALGRITEPADSVLGITVGSISQKLSQP